jgi:uncharacterized membrane protein
MAPFIALLATAWLVWLLAAPFLPTPVSALAYAMGSLVCHQLPERSFHIGAFQLPVCARCLGIYAGAALGAVSGAVPWPGRGPVRAGRLMGNAARWTVGLAALPTAASVVLETTGVWRTTNEVRAAAGLPLGLGVALVVMSVLATLHYNGCVPRRPPAPSPPPHI